MNTQPAINQFDHFIPVSTSRLIDKLAQSGLSSAQIEVIDKLRQVVSFQFHQKLVAVKKLYLPLNPDRDLLTQQDQSADAEKCIHDLTKVLVAANYCELNQQQIEYALQKTSPYGLEVSIDFSAFSNVSLFYRGKSSSTIEIRDWKKLYLKKKTVNLIQYQRLFLLLRYHEPTDKPGLHLKLFKDILRPDLEMLFPECTIRMKVFDKIKLAITGGGGTAGGIFATIGKISAALNPWSITIAIAGFAMLLWRQVSKIFIQKTRYMATLAQNLYFHNLDNNAGAITYLIDLARQEEIKETILAYALIHLNTIENQEALDSACETWFEKNFGISIDFDISDAMHKLKQFDILSDDNSQMQCRSPEHIIDNLEKQWMAFIHPQKQPEPE